MGGLFRIASRITPYRSRTAACRLQPRSHSHLCLIAFALHFIQADHEEMSCIMPGGPGAQPTAIRPSGFTDEQLSLGLCKPVLCSKGTASQWPYPSV